MLNQQTRAQTSPTQLPLPALSPKTATSQESPLTVYLRLPESERKARFLDTLDIAQKFGLAQRTVQNWINQHLIAAVPLGKKKYKVDVQSVEAYLRRLEKQYEAD